MSQPQNIGDTFERIAAAYESHAALEKEVCSRLLEKAVFNRLPPQTILDLGCGTGFAAKGLRQAFRKARVVGLDRSMAMLQRMRRRSGLLRPIRAVRADIGALPFAARSADMLVSNLASYWCPDPMRMFSEFRRVLRPDGMLLFSTVGLDPMRELRSAWSAVDASIEFPEFPDLLEIGNALVAAGFLEPVMDVDNITLSYPDLEALFRELEATGTSLLVRGWERGRGQKAALEKAYAPFVADGKYPLSFEIIYGVAFGPREGQPVKTPSGDVATFSVEALRRTRKAR